MRSLSEFLGPRRPSAAALAPGGAAATASVRLRGERSRRGAFLARLDFNRAAPRGFGAALAACLLIGAAGVGAVRGGQYQAFIAREGSVGDYLARGLGMGVKVVRISGQTRLSESEVLALAVVSPRDSIPLFDVAVHARGSRLRR